MTFGDKLAEFMFEMDYKDGKWGHGKICVTRDHKISSSSTALHYGQSLFEGMKAFINCNGTINVFRPRDHLKRMNGGLYRMCMPYIPIDRVIDGLEELLIDCRNEIPGKSYMYIRPIMIATDTELGSRPAKSYKFMIFLSPIDSSGLFANDLKLMIPPDFVRAVEGGVGNAKTSGNYAASMLSVRIANSMGYNDCLYLDGRERKYIEECSVSNIFFVVDNNTLITPELTGTILPGITRDSIITIGKELGYNVLERKIPINELLHFDEESRLNEIFVCGTAATIKPVKLIKYKYYDIVPKPNTSISLTGELKDTLFDIYYGDPNHKWIHEVV